MIDYLIGEVKFEVIVKVLDYFEESLYLGFALVFAIFIFRYLIFFVLLILKEVRICSVHESMHDILKHNLLEWPEISCLHNDIAAHLERAYVLLAHVLGNLTLALAAQCHKADQLHHIEDLKIEHLLAWPHLCEAFLG